MIDFEMRDMAAFSWRSSSVYFLSIVVQFGVCSSQRLLVEGAGTAGNVSMIGTLARHTLSVSC